MASGGRTSRAEDEVRGLARCIVAAQAPEELPLFDETFAVALRSGRSGRRRDDPLGFGVSEATQLLFTGVACGVAGEVFKTLAQMSGERATSRMVSWFRMRRNRRRQGSAEGEDQAVRPELTPEALTELRGVAQRKAVLLGLPVDKADILADSVVEYLRAVPGSQE